MAAIRVTGNRTRYNEIAAWQGEEGNNVRKTQGNYARPACTADGTAVILP
ncbi:protein of unknown function [Xenorhabdus doucetiae]|uniref:Uncharacterized protein n=1 Tax=Xenorhabdus doucetiae TaxID=351671 RepID=A0A068QP98_9GAMM|nr:protein of unknown function [Xenorhabdus doucetiae]